MTLSTAIRAFYTAYKTSPQASNRQIEIQNLCCAELTKRGLREAKTEVPMPGAYRPKEWDVGILVNGEPRLAISCKSIIRNHAGTVPNRVDDMLGEAANLHRLYPRAVLGYLLVMSRVDEGTATKQKTARLGGMTRARRTQLKAEGDNRFRQLVESVSRAAGREGVRDWREKFEAVSCLQVDFTTRGYTPERTGGLPPQDFFDRLAQLYRQRF